MHFNLFNKYAHTQPISHRGFGLIELMVSMTIMALVSTVVLVKNKSFNNALLLRNQAYEIAFALRQTQLMAVSGTQENSTDSKQFGIFFDFTDSTKNTKYLIFRDDGDTVGLYDSADTQIGGLGSIDTRFMIKDIVGASSTALSGTVASVTFVRPNFDALIKTTGGYISGPVYIIIAPKDSPAVTRQIEITNTGQISVI